jgi:DNA-binding MarR family transcriptional regulator
LYDRTIAEVRDVDRLQGAFAGLIRALGVLRPDTTPCGQPMSVTEAHAISELHRVGPISQSRLADALGLQKSTISRLVTQLEAADLVTRQPNPSDRRSRLIALTPNGTRRARRLAAARAELFAELLDHLTPAQRRTAVEGLTHLEAAARARS